MNEEVDNLISSFVGSVKAVEKPKNKFIEEVEDLITSLDFEQGD